MCDPTGGVLTMAILSTALTIKSQEEQARAINKQAKNSHEAAVDTAVSNYTQLNRKAVEDQQNASAQQYGLQQETTARVATGRAQAGAAGVFGTSVDAMLLNLAGNGLEAQTTAETNYARTVAANQDKADEIARSAKYGVAGIQTAAGVGATELIGAGLQIGSAYVSSKNQDKQAAKKASGIQ